MTRLMMWNSEKRQYVEQPLTGGMLDRPQTVYVYPNGDCTVYYLPEQVSVAITPEPHKVERRRS